MNGMVMKLPADQRSIAPPHGHPITTGQEAMWFLQQVRPDSGSYNVAGAFNLHFPADITILTSAIEAIVARHEIFRSVFRTLGGSVRRFPLPALRPTGALDVLNVPDMSEEALRNFARELAERPFDLVHETPLRATLLRRGSSAPDILLIVAHHIATDDVTQRLVFRDVLTAYSARLSDADCADAAGGNDFEALVGRERTYLASSEAAAARTYWQRELDGIDTGVDLLTDLPRPAVYEYRGSEIPFTLPTELAARLKEDTKGRGVTEFTYFMCVFQALLYRHGGQTDFVIGYPVSLRTSRAFRESFGCLINTLPFRVSIDPNDSFETVLHRTSDKLWRALRHREYPLALISRDLRLRPDPARTGLLQALITTNTSNQTDSFYSASLSDMRFVHAGLEVSVFYVSQQLGQDDLTLEVFRHEDIVTGKLKYNSALFSTDTARRLANDYLGLLDMAATHAWPRTMRELRGASDSPDEPKEA
ncbi:condensation domain-containing protein [Streptomyces sp. NPDC001137]|uniref:condensation domain-containing protein n=1 Tax=Streptomyces sp. NPDC001137 TaxID=3154378 RepID=UPI003325AB73